MIVFQISTGEVTGLSLSCMATVAAWAGTNGYEYRLFTELPQDKDFCNVVSACNYYRVKFAADIAPCLYVDRDILLKPHFYFDTSKFTCDKKDPDAMFFMDGIPRAKSLVEDIEIYRDKEGYYVQGRLWKILKRDPKYAHVNFDDTHYTHFKEHMGRQLCTRVLKRLKSRNC